MVCYVPRMLEISSPTPLNTHKPRRKLTSLQGNIVRLGPDYYSINDPEAVKIIYGHGTKFIKSEWYRAWQLPLEFLEVNMFAQRDIQQHSNARRRYANLYSMSSLVEYEPFVDDCIDLFCNTLDDCAKKNEPLQLNRLFQYYAFDVIGAITVCPMSPAVFSGQAVLILPSTPSSSDS